MTETIEFFNQWTNRPVVAAQVFEKPTCTVPDQYMTIAEIIAKFTRTGLVPRTYLHNDEGGNSAFSPDFDPMDDGQEFMEAAKEAASHGSEQAPSEPVSEPEPESATGAGNGGV